MGLVTRYGNYSGSAPTEEFALVATRFYLANASKLGIIVLYGAGSVASSDFAADLTAPVLGPQRLWAANNPCMSADCASTASQATWANAASVARMTDAFNYLTGTLGAKTGKIGLCGVSHGSLTCLAWAVQNPTKVAFLYLSLPACDVQDIHDNRAAGLATLGLAPSNIEAAYGGLSGYNAAMPAANPAHSQANLAGIPARIFYSSNDPIVDASTVTALGSAIGSSATLIDTGANGHGTGGYVDTGAVAFVQAHS